jgi:hypothetical protein
VRDRDRDMLRNPARNRHVDPVVGVALPGPEREGKKVIPHSCRDTEDRAVSAGHEPRRRVNPAEHRERFVRQVADEEVLAAWRPEHQRLHGWKTGCCRLEADLSVPVGARQRQSIVR